MLLARTRDGGCSRSRPISASDFFTKAMQWSVSSRYFMARNVSRLDVSHSQCPGIQARSQSNHRGLACRSWSLIHVYNFPHYYYICGVTLAPRVAHHCDRGLILSIIQVDIDMDQVLDASRRTFIAWGPSPRVVHTDKDPGRAFQQRVTVAQHRFSRSGS